MWQAECLNEDCGHEWDLTKHPKDYSSGVACPQCGTTDTFYDRKGNGGGGGGSAQEPAQEHTEAVERRQPQQETQEVARRQQGGGFGQGLADATFTAFDSDAPLQDRADAGRALFGVGLQFAERLSDHQEARQEAMRERARDVDLQPASDMPECLSEGCTYRFDAQELAESTVKCPQCGEVFDVIER